MGLPNVVYKIDGTPGQGMSVLANFANIFSQQIENITGVNSAMKGQQQGADQLVGVMQLMIKRGSVTQERFFDAFENIFKNCYQALASVGKRFYIANKKELIDMVGDEGADVIVLSDDMNNEDFRVSTIRSLSPEDERKETDTKILQFVQMGFLDKTRAANLIGRAYEEDLWRAIREAVKEQNLLQSAQEKQQQQQQQQVNDLAMQSAEEDNAEMQNQQAIQLKENAADRDTELQKELISAYAKTAGKTQE